MCALPKGRCFLYHGQWDCTSSPGSKPPISSWVFALNSFVLPIQYDVLLLFTLSGCLQRLYAAAFTDLFQQFGQFNPPVIKGSGVVGFFPNVDSDHQGFNFYLRNLLVLRTIHIEAPPQSGFVPFFEGSAHYHCIDGRLAFQRSF